MNEETKIINLLGKAFTINWCDVCQTVYIECPRCHNNTCNGGHGEDGNCPICTIAYEIDTKLQAYFVTEDSNSYDKT